MPNSISSFYAVLGVKSSATPEEIKRQYRELARRYHPDVNSSPDAVAKIKSLNEAYHVVGDPERRATYDAERALMRDLETRPSPPQGNASTRRHGPETRRDSRHRTPPMRDDRQSRPQPPHRDNFLNDVLREASVSFMSRQYDDAEAKCKEALRANAQYAPAYEMLGDIYERRGRREAAATAYSFAIQFNPRSTAAQIKLERTSGRTPTYRGPVLTRPDNQSAWREPYRSAGRDTALAGFSLVMLCAFVAVLWNYVSNPGGAAHADFPCVLNLPPAMLGALLANGAIAGILLGLYGGMRPIAEDIVPQTSQGMTPRRIPFGLVVTTFSIVNLPLAIIIYGVIGGISRHFSPSINRLFILVTLLTAGFTYLYVAAVDVNGAVNGAVIVGAFSGSALFPAAMCGWYISDLIRLRHQS